MTAVSYVDRRDTLNRLGRIHVTGATAVSWLDSLDPAWVRAIDDLGLAFYIGGTVGFARYPYSGLYPSPQIFPNGTESNPPPPAPPPPPDDPDVWS